MVAGWVGAGNVPNDIVALNGQHPEVMLAVYVVFFVKIVKGLDGIKDSQLRVIGQLCHAVSDKHLPARKSLTESVVQFGNTFRFFWAIPHA